MCTAFLIRKSLYNTLHQVEQSVGDVKPKILLHDNKFTSNDKTDCIHYNGLSLYSEVYIKYKRHFEIYIYTVYKIYSIEYSHDIY